MEGARLKVKGRQLHEPPSHLAAACSTNIEFMCRDASPRENRLEHPMDVKGVGSMERQRKMHTQRSLKRGRHKFRGKCRKWSKSS